MGIAQLVFSLKGLIILPILAKSIGVANYGIWSLILVTVSLIQPFILLGLDNAMLRFLSSKKKDEIIQGIITVSLVILFIGSFISISLILLSEHIALYLFENNSLKGIIKIASILFPLSALNTVLLGSFRIFGKINRYSFVKILQTFIGVVLLSFFVLSGYGLIGSLSSLVITEIITIGIMAYLILSYAGWKKPDFSIIKPFLTYGLPLIPTVIFTFVVSSSDRYVIGFFLGSSSVGTYSAAYSLGGMILIFSSVIMYVLRPTIYDKFDHKEIETVKLYLSYTFKYLMMLLIPSVFGLSILSKPLLMTLTTSEFVNVNSIIVVTLVAIGVAIYSIEQLFGIVVMLSKKTIIFSIVLVLSGIINVGFNIILIPHFGIIAAAITTIISYGVMLGIIYRKSRQYLIFNLNYLFILKSVFASIIMYVVIWGINPSNILFVSLSILIGVFLYFTILVLVRGISKNEIKSFLSILKS